MHANQPPNLSLTSTIIAINVSIDMQIDCSVSFRCHAPSRSPAAALLPSGRRRPAARPPPFHCSGSTVHEVVLMSWTRGGGPRLRSSGRRTWWPKRDGESWEAGKVVGAGRGRKLGGRRRCRGCLRPSPRRRGLSVVALLLGGPAGRRSRSRQRAGFCEREGREDNRVCGERSRTR
jgi:hypothetical protein